MKKIIIVCLIFILANVSNVLANKSIRPSSLYKACLGNIRVLQSAVEMYNMDNSVIIENIDENTINILLKEKYIHSIPKGPNNSCKYLTNKKLSDGGEVYCEYHGGLDKNKIKPSQKYEIEGDIIRKDPNYFILVIYGLMFLIICHAVIQFIKFLFSPNKKIIDFK